MEPEEQLRRLERLEATLDRVALAVGRLEAELARWAAVLPDPESVRARLGRRRLARSLIEDGG